MEFLKELLGEELYSQVAKKLEGNDKVKLANLASGEYVSKDKYQAAELQAKEHKTQLDGVQEKLKELNKAAGNNQELTAKISEWQTKYESDTKVLNDKLSKQALDYAVDIALKDSKARNTKATRALLDESKLSYADGKLTGLEEQLKAVKEANSYLFDDGVLPGSGGAPQGANGGNTTMGFDFSGIPSVLPK